MCLCTRCTLRGNEILSGTSGGASGLLLTRLHKVKAGVKGGLVYLVLLEVQEVGRSHLHRWRGALGSTFP